MPRQCSKALLRRQTRRTLLKVLLFLSLSELHRLPPQQRLLAPERLQLPHQQPSWHVALAHKVRGCSASTSTLIFPASLAFGFLDAVRDARVVQPGRGLRCLLELGVGEQDQTKKCGIEQQGWTQCLKYFLGTLWTSLSCRRRLASHFMTSYV